MHFKAAKWKKKIQFFFQQPEKYIFKLWHKIKVIKIRKILIEIKTWAEIGTRPSPLKDLLPALYFLSIKL